MNYIVTPRDAEQNAATRMRELGFLDAKVTKEGPDEGIDVRSRDAIAQVKNWLKPVGLPDLQRLYGARNSAHHLRMLFFARTGYSKGAISYADKHEIALFTFNHTGAITAANAHACSLTNQSRRTTYSLVEDIARTAQFARLGREARKVAAASAQARAAEQAEAAARVRRAEMEAKEAAAAEAAAAARQITPAMAIEDASKRLTLLGFGAELEVNWTGYIEDDVDMYSSTAIARVRVRPDLEVTKSDLDALQDLPGADAKQLFYFCRRGYSPYARSHADKSRIALFQGGTKVSKAAQDHVANQGHIARAPRPKSRSRSLYDNPYFQNRQS